jgi:hypothetical protein
MQSLPDEYLVDRLAVRAYIRSEMENPMHHDPVLNALLTSRGQAADAVAHYDRLIELHKVHLEKSSSLAVEHIELPAKIQPDKTPSVKSDILPPASDNKSKPGIMKATQDTALEILYGGRDYVRTGEALQGTKEKGYEFPGKDASKYAYSYLKSCPELENFVLNKDKNIKAWRLRKRTANPQPLRLASAVT